MVGPWRSSKLDSMRGPLPRIAKLFICTLLSPPWLGHLGLKANYSTGRYKFYQACIAAVRSSDEYILNSGSMEVEGRRGNEWFRKLLKKEANPNTCDL